MSEEYDRLRNAVMDDILSAAFEDRTWSAQSSCVTRKPRGRAVYEPVRENNVPERPGRARKVIEEIRHINPKTPRMHLLAGAEWQLAITDTEPASHQGGLISTVSEDLLRDPQDFRCVDAAVAL